MNLTEDKYYKIMTKEEKKEYSKKYYLKNKERLLKKQNEYRLNNLDKIKNYKEENKDKINEYQKEYRENNIEKFKEYEKNRDDNTKRQKKYNSSNKRRIQRRKTRKKTIADTWRSVLHSSLKKLGKVKEGRTIYLLGYSAIDLKEHLEKQFIDGMNWDNHGEWHIDHIYPLSKFDKTTPINVVNALNNLQPLSVKDNLTKFNKIT
jgi:hypothetical protein